MMISYEVTIEASDTSVERLDDYMIDKHIPDVLSAGCFVSARYYRDGQRRRTIYEAETNGDLERYLAEYAESLRADFAEHFPNSVSVSREIWEAVVGFSPAEP
ncbi:MAG: DUF4286 family protein [Pyrinomonadaceae bacterium]|nr:DUF4286 family protein [Pyrinomonadaceae bacterium]